MFIVQMHIKSEVKSFEVRACQGFTRFVSPIWFPLPWRMIYAYLNPNTFLSTNTPP